MLDVKILLMYVIEKTRGYMTKVKNKSRARPGNKNGVKLKAPEVRQEAFKQYIDHLSQGLPKQAWCFEHPEFTCTFKTLEKYIRDNPCEFPPIHKEVAHAKSYKTWFEKGTTMMEGKVEKCQPAIYQMIMRNMFDWDKENSLQKETSAPLIKKMAAKWRGKDESI